MQLILPPGVTVEAAGVVVAESAVLNFVTGTVVFNPTTGAIDITPSGGGGPGLFVAGGSSGAGKLIMTSPDGLAWTERNTPWDGAGGFVGSVAFGGI
jgi:hypothetical protein